MAAVYHTRLLVSEGPLMADDVQADLALVVPAQGARR
jgi:hypothetical protein